MKASGVVGIALLLIGLAPGTALSAASPAWTDDFALDRQNLSSTGRNPYFILEPGYQLVFRSKDGDLTITVLNETKTVDGVETRVVEEREKENGKLVEVSRNYYAISRTNNSVFYFGEDVDLYDAGGKVKGHGGSWHAGVGGARAGLMMPGMALVGSRYYQEVAPKVAMDRAETISTSESMTTPAGRFSGVLKSEETTPLEPGTREYKYYAPGVGLIKDGDMVLVEQISAR